jgi:hypothetical protein
MRQNADFAAQTGQEDNYRAPYDHQNLSAITSSAIRPLLGVALEAVKYALVLSRTGTADFINFRYRANNGRQARPHG